MKPRSTRDELAQLRGLLAKRRLSYRERIGIERRIRELTKPKVQDEPPQEPQAPGRLGVFDLPEVLDDGKTALSNSAPVVQGTETVKQSVEPEPSETEQPLLEPSQAEELAEKIARLADHIGFLKSCWVTNPFSRELNLQIQACIARLQELASQLPPELAEATLGSNVGLLSDAYDTEKDIISERTQFLLHSPSAPALDPWGVMSNAYYESRSWRPPREVKHAAGYVPDGLQALVS